MRRLDNRERGGTLVEAALVLPILILLIFGLVEFGRAYNAQITLTHAAREGVRVLATTQDQVAAAGASIGAATSLDGALIGVSTDACDAGQPTSVTLTYPFTYDIPLFGSNTVTLTGKGVMRCEGSG
jgi:Flp pilus assembly protein TadG